jgi:pimeloyl-ACP methyl ester carboxylesterase
VSTRYQGKSHGIHAELQGDGPMILLLHASPLSLASLQPLAKQLAQHFCVLSIDTPGYGRSDSLLPPAAALDDYVEAIVKLLTLLGVDQLCIYGTATGAQIALEYGKRFPAQVHTLLLDNACHFEDSERARILGDYFPDLSPKPDGSHLAMTMRIVERLFVAFPWFSELPEDQLPAMAPPAALLDALLHDYLRAGPDYARAYRLAFANEHASRYLGLTVPTKLIRNPTSIVKKYVEALIDQHLPACVSVLDVGADRYGAIAQAAFDLTANLHSQSAEHLAKRMAWRVAPNLQATTTTVTASDLQLSWQALDSISDLAQRTDALLQKHWPVP